MPLTQPATNTTAATAPGDARPVADNPVSVAAHRACSDVVTNTNCRRSTRSAIAPPIGPMRPMGRKAAAATNAVQPASPVRTATRSPTATVSIQVPTFETRAAAQTRAKLRWRSGRSDAQPARRRSVVGEGPGLVGSSTATPVNARGRPGASGPERSGGAGGSGQRPAADELTGAGDRPDGTAVLDHGERVEPGPPHHSQGVGRAVGRRHGCSPPAADIAGP